MRVRSSGLTIELSEDEIGLLWNIVMFALDWQSYATKNDVASTMTEDELKLAKELEQITDKLR